jgi:transcriptional regulator of acetoin/glycerol metabolism
MEYSVAVAKIETILPEDLPDEIRALQRASSAGAAAKDVAPEPGSLPTTLVSQESERLMAALDAHHWSRSETARALGLSRSTLWRKMRELDLADRRKP